MANPDAPDVLLHEIDRQRRRTRRLLDSNWFTMIALGVALVVGGLLPGRWGWLCLAFLVLAYAAIALRWRRVFTVFSLGPTSVPLAPFGLSVAIAGGDVVCGAALSGNAAITAVSTWTALGFLVFWRWLGNDTFLVLAGLSIAVGLLQLVVGQQYANLMYGAAFAGAGAVAWLRAGRRTR